MEQFVIFQDNETILLNRQDVSKYLTARCFDEDETQRVLSLKKGQVNEVYSIDDDGFMLKVTVGYLG